MVILVVAAILAMMALGAPLFAVLLSFSAYGATYTSGGSEGRTFFEDFGGQMLDVIKLGTGEPATVLSTIPLFIFAGYLMAESGTADRLIRVTRAGLGWLPGGLAVVTIFAFALFTTFTGASGVTIVALGALLFPSLVKEKYPERFSLGLIGGTGSVGLLFPPALPLFVYGTIYGLVAQTMAQGSGPEIELIDFETSRFVFAGIVPGLVLLGILSCFAVFVAIKRGVPRHRFNPGELARGLPLALPELVIPVLVIVGLAEGMQIPEVAALAAVYTLILEVFVYRDLPLRKLWRVVREAMTLTGAIFIIIFAAAAFSNFLVTAEVPQEIFRWITSTILPEPAAMENGEPVYSQEQIDNARLIFLLGLNVFLLMVGMTMDIFSAIVVVVPLIAPAAALFGVDPYHLGVIFLLNLELGYLTPPVGLNLFITAFAFKRPLLDVVRATLPFLGCMAIALVLVTYIPELTVVPPPERRGRVSKLVKDVRDAHTRAMSVEKIELPDGEILERSRCEEYQDPNDQIFCSQFFSDVTTCRKEAGGEIGSECEEEAIQEYMEYAPSEEEEIDWDEELEGLE